jgi:hypothetical protein
MNDKELETLKEKVKLAEVCRDRMRRLLQAKQGLANFRKNENTKLTGIYFCLDPINHEPVVKLEFNNAREMRTFDGLEQEREIPVRVMEFFEAILLDLTTNAEKRYKELT